MIGEIYKMDKILLITYNILLLLLPVTLNFYGVTYSKIIFGYSIFVFLYLKVTKRISKNIFNNKTFKYLSMGFFAFFVVIVLSFLVNKFINANFGISRVFEVMRILEYYLVLMNYFILLKKETFRGFKISLLIIVFLNIILSFFQYYNLFGLNELYIKKIAPTQYMTLVNEYPWPRSVGLTGNPNVLGFLMTLLSVYFLYFILQEPKKWYNYIPYFLIVIVLYQSSSRTSYITLVMSNACLAGLYFLKFNKKDIIKTILISLSLVIIHISLLFILPDSYTWRIKTLLDFRNQNSYENRMKKNRENLLKYMLEDEEIVEDEDSNIFDNEWIMMLFRYSIVGIIVFITMMIIPIKTIKENKEFSYSIYISLVIATFVYMLVAASFHSYLLFNITMVFTAISLKINQNVICLPEGEER